jgi:hypothetical protein
MFIIICYLLFLLFHGQDLKIITKMFEGPAIRSQFKKKKSPIFIITGV